MLMRGQISGTLYSPLSDYREWENYDNYDNDYGSNNGDWVGNTYHHVESFTLAMHHT